ncbi:DUF427 domain-containing protein [Oligoflexaceae bacterium]|nr:DUF427 domain-containing protein [Oligoflexaceae bacterium]
MTVKPQDCMVTAFVGNTKIAEAEKVWIMNEVAHIIINPVYYFHSQNVLSEVLAPSSLTTRCPLKGDASYYHIDLNGERIENAAWAYNNPIAEAEVIKGLMAFDPRAVVIKNQRG